MEVIVSRLCNSRCHQVEVSGRVDVLYIYKTSTRPDIYIYIYREREREREYNVTFTFLRITGYKWVEKIDIVQRHIHLSTHYWL